MKKNTLLALLFLYSVSFYAQWSLDTSVNTLVAASSTIDTESLVGTNNKTYTVFWKSVPAINYELRLQILDANGNQELGADGVLISNTIPMGTYASKWSLTLDANNNVYVGVTGTNGNGGYVFKLDSTGNNLWTSQGVSLGSGFLVRTLPLSSGETLVSWLNASNGQGLIQKISSAGNPVWANPISLGSSTVSDNMYELSNGDFIAIYHAIGSGISSTLYAKKFNTAGTSQWANPTQLFPNGKNTVYNARYYGVQDGDVIYYSFKLSHSSRFDAYIQKINADGSLPWGASGVDFDTNQTLFEQEIQIAKSSNSQFLWALCRYTNSSQGQQGVYIQKLDKNTGQRMLTDNAKEVYALGTTGPTGDFRVTESDKPIFLTALSSNHIEVNLLDENGDFVWVDHSKPMATFNASKSDVNFSPKSNSQEYILTFAEDRGQGNKIFAQNFTDPQLLSVENYQNKPSLSYDNPITNSLEIESSEPLKSIEIYNNLGQLIQVQPNINNKQVSVASHSWAPGMYYVILNYSSDLNKTIKIVKR